MVRLTAWDLMFSPISVQVMLDVVSAGGFHEVLMPVTVWVEVCKPETNFTIVFVQTVDHSHTQTPVQSWRTCACTHTHNFLAKRTIDEISFAYISTKQRDKRNPT